MKKALLILFIIILLVGGYFGGKYVLKQIKINKIKQGWYVEVLYEKGINIRENHSTEGEPIGTAIYKEVYKVTDVYLDSKVYYWYKIEFDDGEGWIANKKGEKWLDDVNNPYDIAAPTIKFKENVYKVNSMDDINYKHLEVYDDKGEYTITHKVYYEYNYVEQKDQYWIAYTVTDTAGKTTTKLQKIEFVEPPLKSEITDFAEYHK